jgi:hypothetical protein
MALNVSFDFSIILYYTHFRRLWQQENLPEKNGTVQVLFLPAQI